MKIFGREPAFWIGLAVTLILGVVTTLNGSGLISDIATGQVTDAVNAIAQLLTLLAPLIVGILIRPVVTPVVDPMLKQGTTVTIITPGDLPNKATIL